MLSLESKKKNITQKNHNNIFIIHLVILLVITQIAHCSRFCLDAIVRSGLVDNSQGARWVTMRMCNVSRGRVLQLIAMANSAGFYRSGGEHNPKCGNLRC